MAPLGQVARLWVQDNAQGYMDRNLTKGQASLKEVVTPQQQVDLQIAAEDTDKAEKLEHENLDEVERLADVELPEVLDYHFGLAKLTLPAEDDPSVGDPALDIGNGFEGKESNPFDRSCYSKAQNNSLVYYPRRFIILERSG